MVGHHQGFLLTVTVMSIVMVVVTAVLMLMPLDAILTQMVSIVSHMRIHFCPSLLSPPLSLSLSLSKNYLPLILFFICPFAVTVPPPTFPPCE